MEVLTCVHQPETVLRWMNEAGVFGRFVPDFGRVVAQMQFDMYHHYTVDEHSIRAIGLLAAIERGELKQDHPISTAIFRQIASRRVLYVAVLLHDIAKGRGGDHSVHRRRDRPEALPALRARCGRDRDRLVACAPPSPAVLDRVQARPRRPQDDRRLRPPGAKPGTASAAADPHRRRHPRGRPGHLERMEADAPSDAVRGRRRAASARPQATRPRRNSCSAAEGACGGAGLEGQRRRAHARRLPDSYWLAEPLAWQVANARQVADAEARIGDAKPSVVVEEDPESGATRVSVFTPDREGLFYRICAGLASAGANIIDARIHTTRDGMALDNLLVLDGRGQPYRDRRLRTGLVKVGRGGAVARSRHRYPRPGRRAGRTRSRSPRRSQSLSARRREPPWSRSMRATARRCSPRSPPLSTRRPPIHSAHIATYGERAVDVFYLTHARRAKLDA